MYKQCQTEQSAQRQRELEQGLLKCMLKHRFEDISVSDMCQEIGVPRKSFYRYFSGKDGALLALIDHALMDFDRHSTVDNQQKGVSPQSFMENVFSYWMQRSSLLDALQKSNLSGILIQRAIEYTKSRDTLPQFLQFEEKQLRDYGTMFAVCGMMTMIVQWHKAGFEPGVKQMATLAIRLLGQPLFTISDS